MVIAVVDLTADAAIPGPGGVEECGAILIIAVIVIGGGLLVWNTPTLRSLVFAPTFTPTFTPTPSPTSTPGYTPTPSPTPEVSSTPRPTIDASVTPGGTLAPRATEVYPQIVSRGVLNAVNLIDRGDYAEALPTLERERDITEFSFDPAPYYYEALALIGTGDLEVALARMQEAEGRLSETPNRNNRPLVDLGFAQVHLALAKRALAEDNGNEANDQLEAAEQRAQAALERDPKLVESYVILSQRYVLDRRYSDALAVLDQGLDVEGLKYDTNLLVARGEVFYAQGNYNLAEEDAYTALYVDPTLEAAHLLAIRSVLAEGDAGLAVIYSNRYLYYYPGSALGYKLRADARVAEGNLDLALIDYSQALVVEDQSQTTVDALVARADIYSQQNRFDLAEQDLTQAFRISNDPAIRAKRMIASYKAGVNRTALADAEALDGQNVIPEAEIQLLRARILVDDAGPNATDDLDQAIDLLSRALNALPADEQATANEYRARAQYLEGNYRDALVNLDRALGEGETGSRRFLRGEILEGLEEPQDALREYEWVLTWSQIYPYPFVGEARSRYTAIESALAEGS